MAQRGQIWISFCLTGLIAVFLVYYLYMSLGQLIPFAFTKPHLWEEHWMVRGVVEIPFWLRMAYFLVWIVAILATALMLLAAMHLLHLLRKGQFFGLKTIRAVQQVGVCAFLAGISIIAANSLWPWMITMMNETERQGIGFGYDSSQAGIALLGAGIFMLGWVLKYAALLAQENKEFV